MQLTDAAAPRRTQAERREHTRRLLLEATIASLAELGYSGTTTLEVERRAGVSRGARTHHFPSKAALLAGAVDHLYEQLRDHYAEAFSGAKQRRSDRQRIRAGLHLLFAIYQRPHYGAVLGLNAAARSDAELRERLQAVALRHRGFALAAAREFFPTLSKSAAERLIETIHASFIGLRVQGGVTADEHQFELVLTALEDLVVAHLQTQE